MLRASAFGSLIALLILAPACSSTSDGDEESDDGELREVSREGQWVVDLAKVKREYCGNESCTSKSFFGVDPQSVEGLPPPAGVVWDQAFKYDMEHRAMPADREFPAVKDGNKIFGPKGKRVNIIPMLRNTDPSKQVHIIKHLQDGDVLVYFHPEYLSASELMERRTSHVGMHYEYKLGSKLYVHHIDNPNNYGPRYNHLPNEHMPFHVFRYRPKGMNEATSAKWGTSARNWGFITDDLSPFADFFHLTLRSVEDLETKFKKRALAGEQTEELYCSGLAYSNLNLGVNFPLNRSGLGSDWSSFSRKKFHRDEFRADLAASDITADEGLRTENKALVFEPYTPSELATAWLDNTFQNLPVEARKGIAMMPETQQNIAGGFSQLEFSDKRGAGGRRNQRNEGMSAEVAAPQNIKVWAEAYGLKAEQTEGFVNEASRKILTPNGERTLRELVQEARISLGGKTPLQVIRALELKYVKNQFVPPRIWLDQADREDSPMVYVGTVLNCELLAAADGSNKDACTGGDAGSDEFSQGAADTATYPHYAIPNGGERTHRRFDSTPGPEKLGYGSVITVRGTAADASDVLFLLHTPEMFAEQSEDLRSLDMMEYDHKCTELARDGKSCAPKRGIVLDHKQVDASGTVEDKSYKFFLTGSRGVCQIENDDKMKCPVAERTASGWRVVGTKSVSRKARGLISTTMVDTKQQSAASSRLRQPERCTQCSTGGAQFNGWHAQIRNDEPSGDR